MQEIRSSNPLVTGICDPNKSRARHHRSSFFVKCFICQCKNYSWLILCIMTWGCNFVAELNFLTVSHTFSLHWLPNLLWTFQTSLFYQNSFPSFFLWYSNFSKIRNLICHFSSIITDNRINVVKAKWTKASIKEIYLSKKNTSLSR